MTTEAKKALILGAGGQVARWAVDMLGDHDDVAQTLYLRTPAKLGRPSPANARLVQGDVMDAETLKAAMAGQDVVYANLFGDMDAQAEAIVAAMKETGVKKLIFVTSLGIYDEVPGQFGEWNRREIGAYLPPYRRAADIVRGVRPGLRRPAPGVADRRRRDRLRNHDPERAVQWHHRLTQERRRPGRRPDPESRTHHRPEPWRQQTEHRRRLP